MKQQNPTPNDSTSPSTPAPQAVTPAYEPPRIITHSGESLKKQGLTVNACTSLIP